MTTYKVKSIKFKAEKFNPILFESFWRDYGVSRVRLTTDSYTVECTNGVNTVKDGDWIVRSESGSVWAMSDEVFQVTYEAISDSETL